MMVNGGSIHDISLYSCIISFEMYIDGSSDKIGTAALDNTCKVDTLKELNSPECQRKSFESCQPERIHRSKQSSLNHDPATSLATRLLQRQ